MVATYCWPRQVFFLDPLENLKYVVYLHLAGVLVGHAFEERLAFFYICRRQSCLLGKHFLSAQQALGGKERKKYVTMTIPIQKWIYVGQD